MRQHFWLISGGILGSLVLAGCGLNGNLNATPAGNGTVHISGTVQTSGVPTSPSPSNTTPTSNTSGGSSTSTSSSTGTSQSSTSSSLSSNVVTVRNPSAGTFAEKIAQGKIYGVADAQPNAPGQVVMLTAKQVFATPPTMLHHWPPQRFNVVAVFTNPENQLGVTPWINGLSHDVHWLHKAPGLSIAVVIQNGVPTTSSTGSSSSQSSSSNNSTSSSVIRITNPSLTNVKDAIYSGIIYGVNDPQTHDTIFFTLKTPLTATPTTLHHWPSQRFKVYAILTNAENQLGGPNGTAWINGLGHDVHWLKLAPNVVIQVEVNNA